MSYFENGAAPGLSLGALARMDQIPFTRELPSAPQGSAMEYPPQDELGPLPDSSFHTRIDSSFVETPLYDAIGKRRDSVLPLMSATGQVALHGESLPGATGLGILQPAHVGGVALQREYQHPTPNSKNFELATKTARPSNTLTEMIEGGYASLLRLSDHPEHNIAGAFVSTRRQPLGPSITESLAPEVARKWTVPRY